MKVLQWIFLFAALLVFFVLVFASFLPKTYEIAESIVIDVEWKIVRVCVADFRHFADWNPLKERDPHLKEEISGAPLSVGGTYKWFGNKDVGAGSQTIVGISEDRVDIDLHLVKPFDSQAKTFFLLEPKGCGTKITWGLHSEIPWPFNLLRFNLQKRTARYYREGLENLKTFCEYKASSEMTGEEF